MIIGPVDKSLPYHKVRFWVTADRHFCFDFSTKEPNKPSFTLTSICYVSGSVVFSDFRIFQFLQTELSEYRDELIYPSVRLSTHIGPEIQNSSYFTKFVTLLEQFGISKLELMEWKGKVHK